MIKILNIFLLTTTALLLTACMNKQGISAKYYSECKEYYDLQGYYHKKCGDDDLVSYKAIGDGIVSIKDIFVGKKEGKKGNVW
ncbi:MAG: hypothetical protein U9Q29_07740 [Campylobacterota bacterium]|nr:hypothetical protein [Campylobacterota bacterium]